MTTALEIAKQLAEGSTLPSKTILEKLKQVYVANLEQAFFSQIGEHLFNQMDEKDRVELTAFQDAQLAKTYLEQVELAKETRLDSAVGGALSEWDDLFGISIPNDDARSRRGSMTNEKEIREGLRKIMGACGLNGESGTETLFTILDRAMSSVAEQWDEVVGQSHRDGLCYDVNAWLACEIAKAATQREVA